MPKHPRHLSTKSSTQMRRERRQRRSVAPADESATPAATPAATTAPVAQVWTAPTAKATQAARLSPDRYKYVLTELRWIGAMVGVVAVILIILSFVLPGV